MELSVRIVFKKALVSLTMCLLLHSAFAQKAPELIFRNPTLESGTAGQDGAVYRFGNITTGIDGLLTIKGRSGTAVVLNDIDLPNLGWDKALQPQLGITGNVPANQSWWMQFELKFVQSGTTKKSKLKDFVVTSLDVDGDGVSIREFVQMNKMKSMDYSTVTYLKTGTAINTSLLSQIDVSSDGSDSYNLTGTDNMILGPVSNFVDIDTSATSVMATYKYEDKDVITFMIGATSGSVVSNAGMRLNSLWFKQFSLAPVSTLPLKLETFSTAYINKNVVLNWKTTSERDFSHFVIERSVDGKSYSDIALVFAAGGTAENIYSYKDKTAAMQAGIAYYRLRMVDEDRSFSYSFVSSVHLSKNETTSIDVYPNPAKNSVSISVPGTWQGKTINLKIYNGTGALKTNKEIKMAGTSADIALSNLPTGIYIVEAAYNGEAARKMILKN